MRHYWPAVWSCCSSGVGQRKCTLCRLARSAARVCLYAVPRGAGRSHGRVCGMARWIVRARGSGVSAGHVPLFLVQSLHLPFESERVNGYITVLKCPYYVYENFSN